MDVTAKSLHERYSSMNTKALSDFYHESELTDLAVGVLEEVITSRGLDWTEFITPLPTEPESVGDWELWKSEQARIDAFVTKNTDYYLKKWQSFENGAVSVVSFNTAAFFATVFWLIYRKLYVPLLVVVAVTAADIAFTTYLEESGVVSGQQIAAWERFSPMLYATVIASFGNYWYWRKFQRIEEQAREHSPDAAIQEAYLRAKGGTNPLGVWVLVAFMVAVVIAVAILSVITGS